MEFLTVAETARLLRVSPVTIRRYIASGQLAAERVGRGIRVRHEAIERFVTPIAPRSDKGRSRGSLSKPITMDDPLRNIVGIGRSNEPTDIAADENELPTVFEPLGNIVGIGRSGEPTNIAERKDEYLADAFSASSSDEEESDSGELLGEPFTMEDPLWNILGIGQADDPTAGAANQDKLPTILEALGITVGIGRTNEPTNVAEHKDEYLADAFDAKG